MISQSLNTSISTKVQLGHLIQFTRSVILVFSSTSLFHTFNITSPAFAPYFSAGEFLIGALIIITHGFNISIYAHIPSNSHSRLSSKFLASFGGKNTVYGSPIASTYHCIAPYSSFVLLISFG